MGYKIASSKAGVNVGTATAPNDFNYSSDYNTLKYYTAGTIRVAGSAVFPNTNRYFGTITHGLGYYPFFSFFATDDSSATNFYPYGFVAVGAGGLTRTACARMGTNTMRFMYKITNASSGTISGTATFYYKIYRNNTNL